MLNVQAILLALTKNVRTRVGDLVVCQLNVESLITMLSVPARSGLSVMLVLSARRHPSQVSSLDDSLTNSHLPRVMNVFFKNERILLQQLNELLKCTTPAFRRHVGLTLIARIKMESAPVHVYLDSKEIRMLVAEGNVRPIKTVLLLWLASAINASIPALVLVEQELNAKWQTTYLSVLAHLDTQGTRFSTAIKMHLSVSECLHESYHS